MKNAPRKTQGKKAGATKKEQRPDPAAEQGAKQPSHGKTALAEPSGLKPWHIGVGAVLLLIVLFQMYQPAIDAPFLFDDKYLPFTHPSYQDYPLSRWLIGVRPSLMFTFWLNYQQSGTDPHSYHVFNVILHFMNGLLVFLILRRLLAWAKSGRWERDLLAAFGGCIFLLHPLQTEAVAYVASRSETLSVFFFFAAFAIFIYRRSSSISFFETALVLLLFGGAITSKEHTAVLPFLLLLTDYFWNPGFSAQGIKRNWKIYAPVVVAGAMGFAFIFNKLAESNTAGFKVEGLPWYIYFVTQCKVIWIYVRMLLLPVGQNIDHDYPMAATALDPLGLLGMAALVAAVVVAWIYRRRAPLASYGLYVFLLLLAPTSSIVPIRDALVERRVYLAMIGALLIAVGLLRLWQTAPRTKTVALAVVVVVAFATGYQRARVWAGPIPLWSDSVEKTPDNWRANFHLAYTYYAEQRCSASVAQYKKTAQIKPPDFRLLVDWALAADCAGQPDEALARLTEATKLEKDAHVYSQIAMVQAKQGRYDEALEALTTGERIDPNFAYLYFYRGNIYAATGRHALAADEYRKALEREPNLQAAQRGLQRSEQALQQAR